MSHTLSSLLTELKDARASGDKDKALALAFELVEASPGDVRGDVAAAQLLAELGRHDEALERATQSLARHPGQLALMTVCFNAHRAKKAFKAAIEAGEQILAAHPAASHYARLVPMYLRENDLNGAQDCAERGLSQFPDDAALIAVASEVARLQKLLDKALEYARRARELDPKAVAPIINESLALAELQRHEEALSTASSGLALFPKNAALLRAAYQAATHVGDYAAAFRYAQARAAGAPRLASARVEELFAAIRVNDLDEAQRLVTQAGGAFANNPSWVNLAWLTDESIAIPKRRGLPVRSRSAQDAPKTKYMFNIPFNIKRWDERPELSNPETGRLSRPWISYRIKLFMNYTCRSLINQTNQDFTALFLCDGASMDIVMDEISKYYDLPGNIKVIDGDDRPRILKEEMDGHEFYYYTKLDSDNMYHCDYVELLHQHQWNGTDKFLAFTKGYALDANSGRIALYRATQEYFYTRVGRVENIKSDFSIKEPIGGSPQALVVPHELIHEPDVFMITCHDINVSNNVAMVRPIRTFWNDQALRRLANDFIGREQMYTLK